IKEIHPYSTKQYMTLDRMTQRNLELTRSLNDGSRRGTLLAILDQTRTPMGARLMQHWIKQPLLSLEKIHERQEAIESLLKSAWALDKLKPHLDAVRDIERLMMKISSNYASPRDIAALRFSMEPMSLLDAYLSDVAHPSRLIHE